MYRVWNFVSNYSLLLVFYVCVVMVVVWLCDKLRVRLERRQMVTA